MINKSCVWTEYIMFFLFSWRCNSLWVLACSAVLFLALLSIAILLPFWIFIFPDPLWHHHPIFTSLYQSFLLQVVSIVFFFSLSFLYPFLQYAQPILFCVDLYIQLYLHVWLANLVTHLFLFTNSHLDWAVCLPYYFPFKSECIVALVILILSLSCSYKKPQN